MKLNKSNHSTKNVFTSKANVLSFLKTKLKKSQIEEIFYFNVDDWTNNPSLIISKIQSEFRSTIIVRSSAMGEDSLDASHAGQYESVLGVNSKSKSEITKSVSTIINSFLKTNFNPDNQILIQNQTKNIMLSGVAFTKTPDTNSPYYVINYEIGTSTDGVTKGLVNNTVKIFKKTKTIPIIWKSLIRSIKELENILPDIALDIEFGITKKKKIKL